MLKITAGRESEFEHVRANLVVSACLNCALDEAEPARAPARRPLPSWIGARRRHHVIPFPSARTLLRRPA